MTMGPAPMIMIEAMSVRFGMQGSGRAPAGAGDSTAWRAVRRVIAMARRRATFESG